MDSRFWDVYRDVRSLIQKPDDALYILHTSIGAITVHRFVYRSEAGYVFLQGMTRKAWNAWRASPNNSWQHSHSRFG